MKKAVLQLDTLVCPSCSMKIESAVKSMVGVDKDSVNVLFNSSKVKLDFDDSNVSVEQINEVITKLGFDVLKSSIK